jgi:PHD/YefM family antitoxin component YafN of YafNO toxin-antitoxin module
MPQRITPKIKNDEVQNTSETRADLTKILAEFRRKGKKAEPIMFGTHRKPEAVIMPARMWRDLLEEMDNLRDRILVLERGNPQDFEEVTIQQLMAEFDEVISRQKNIEDAQNSKAQANPKRPRKLR